MGRRTMFLVACLCLVHLMVSSAGQCETPEGEAGRMLLQYKVQPARNTLIDAQSPTSSTTRPASTTTRATTTTTRATTTTTTLQPSCLITDFGAVGDNATNNTLAVNAALRACSRITFPAPGIYLTNSFTLRSNLALVMDAGATLAALWDFIPAAWNSSAKAPPDFIFGRNLANVSITGKGVIDGRGLDWIALQLSAPSGTDVARPALVNIITIKNLTMSGITLINSPKYNIAAWGSDLVFTGLTILTKEWECKGSRSAPNSDGINLHASNVRISNTFIHNGDDCVPIFGNSANITVENVTCQCGTNGMNMVISGTGPYSISNIAAKNLVVNNTNYGMGISLSTVADSIVGPVKTRGDVTNISWDNIVVLNPRYGLFRNNVFQGTGNTLPSEWRNISSFQVSNVRVSNVVARQGWYVCDSLIYCSAAFPCSNFSFDNVSVTMQGVPSYYKAQCWYSNGGNTSECVNGQGVRKTRSPSFHLATCN